MPKYFVRADGSSVLQKRGDLTDKEINVIEKFIKLNYQDMYKTWKDFGGGDFFRKWYQPFSKTLISTGISTHGLSSFQKKT